MQDKGAVARVIATYLDPCRTAETRVTHPGHETEEKHFRSLPPMNRPVHFEIHAEDPERAGSKGRYCAVWVKIRIRKSRRR